MTQHVSEVDAMAAPEKTETEDACLERLRKLKLELSRYSHVAAAAQAARITAVLDAATATSRTGHCNEGGQFSP